MNLDRSVINFIKNPNKYVLIVRGDVIRSEPKGSAGSIHTSKIALDALKAMQGNQVQKIIHAYRRSLEPTKNFCNLYGIFQSQLNLGDKQLCHQWCEEANGEADFLQRSHTLTRFYYLYAKGELKSFTEFMPSLELLKLMNSLPEFETIKPLVHRVLPFLQGVLDTSQKAKIIRAIELIPNEVRVPILEAMQTSLRRQPISSGAWIVFFLQACRSNHVPGLEALVASDIFSEDDKILALKAPEAHYIEINDILKYGHIAQQKQTDIFQTAISQRNLLIVLAFIEKGISQFTRDEAFLNAIEYRDQDIIEALIRSGISDVVRGVGFSQAARWGFKKVVQTLLELGISQNHKQEALVIAAENGQQAVVHVLLGCELSQNCKIEALAIAAEHSHKAIVKSLLEDTVTSISQQTTPPGEPRSDLIPAVQAFEQALQSPGLSDRAQLVILEAFFAMHVSEQGKDQALFIAVIHNFYTIAQKLLQRGVSIYGRTRAVESAYLKVDFLKALLRSGPIYFEVQQKILKKKLSEDIRALILTAQSVPVPASMSIDAGHARIGRFKVKFSELRDNPVKYLKDIKDYGILPVTFLNEDGTEQVGIDAGGLTKQFISTLITSLRQKALKLDDKRLPIANTAEDIEIYQNLGKLFSDLMVKNKGRSDLIYTGPIFDQDTFGLLQVFLDPYGFKADQMQYLADCAQTDVIRPFVAFLNNQDPTDQDIAEFKKFLKSSYIEGCQDLTLLELRDLCFEYFKSHKLAIDAMISGFSEVLKDKILEQGVLYAPILQGSDTPTFEQFKAVIEVEDERIRRQANWLLEKAQEELLNPRSDWVKKFLFCVTAQSVLPATKIILKSLESGRYCTTSTCFNYLYIPINTEITKEQFLSDFEETMAVVNSDRT